MTLHRSPLRVIVPPMVDTGAEVSSRSAEPTVFRGEGQLRAIDLLGGRRVLGVLGLPLLVVLAMGALYGPRDPADLWGWLPLAAGLAFVGWLAYRSGLLHALASLARGAPRPRWEIEVDELGVRHVERDGVRAPAFDWFEIEGYDVTELGIVLRLRLPKDGANAVLLPRRFFAADRWEPLVALVRSKLPSAARAHDAAAAASTAARTPAARRTLLLWVALVGALTACWYVFGRD